MEKKNLDWANLGFGYHVADYRFVANYKDGKWDDGEITTDANITLNECAGSIPSSRPFLSPSSRPLSAAN